jgi:4-amino-4-deoxy-L-arabinose transferase-like glycosyltransferase
MKGTLLHLHRWGTFLRILLLAFAALFVLMFFIVAVARLSYPFELEWLEGGSMTQVSRILSGKPVYVPPTLEFTPYPYTPLYFYLSAAVAAVTGIGFAPLRLVSLAATLGSMILIYRFVRRETESLICAFLSAAFFAATFRLGGAWFDVARVDSLMVFILLLGAYIWRKTSSNGSACVTGLFMGLAFFAKQAALPVGAAFGLQILFPGKRRWTLIFLTTFLGSIAVSTALLNRFTSGWYFFYMFEQARGHTIIPSLSLEVLSSDFARPLGIVIGLCFLYLYHLAAKGRAQDLQFSCLFLAGMIGTAWISRIHVGGYDNVLMPAHAVLAIYFGLGLDVLLNRYPSLLGARDRSHWIEAPVYALCLVLFLSLLYNPLHQIPTAADRAAGAELVRRVRAIEGDVMVVSHGYLGSRAGKTGCTDLILNEILLSGNKTVVDPLRSEIKNAILGGKFKAILLDTESWYFMEEIRKRYSCAGPFFSDETVFWTRTGMKVRPEELCLLRDSPAP